MHEIAPRVVQTNAPPAMPCPVKTPHDCGESAKSGYQESIAIVAAGSLEKLMDAIAMRIAS